MTLSAEAAAKPTTSETNTGSAQAAGKSEGQGEDLLERCINADFKVNLYVIKELLNDAPEKVALPALALRQQAREGKLPDDLIPVLAHLAGGAPTDAAFVHFTKALAAFGRSAAPATPHVIFRLQNTFVTNDQSFWVLDSAIYALGYMGGDEAKAFITELQGEDPSRVLKSKSVYKGTLSDDQRAAIHERTLTKVAEMLGKDDAGKWDRKMTSLKRKKPEPKKKNEPAGGGLKPWMTR